MYHYIVTARTWAHQREETLHFAALSRDDALFQAGCFMGKHYPGTWEIMQIHAESA